MPLECKKKFYVAKKYSGSEGKYSTMKKINLENVKVNQEEEKENENFSYHRTKNLIYDRKRKYAISEKEFRELLVKNYKTKNEKERKKIQTELKKYPDGRFHSFKFQIFYQIFETKLVPTLLMFGIHISLLEY